MAKQGRPPHQPTTKDRTYVESLASYGVPEEDIARVMGINHLTLGKHYRRELDLGHVKTNAQVAGFLFTAAKKGSVPAMMFWLRCRAKWSEPRDQTAGMAPGKKEAAATAAQQLDISSPFDRVIAARAERNVGSELSGLARPSVAWPVADPRSSAQ
jgi:hypothetical protein